MSGWQPIETAPAQTRVFVYRPGAVSQPVVGEDILLTDGGPRWYHSCLSFPPTHWRPFPEDPLSDRAASDPPDIDPALWWYFVPADNDLRY